MRPFSALSALLALATLAVVVAKAPEPTPKEEPPVDRFTGVAFRNATAAGGISCSFVYDVDVGSEFAAKFMGTQQIRVAQGRSGYWFWMRRYDHRRYHHCSSDDVHRSGVIPPLRPSFSRWMVNREQGSSKFADGEYSVEIEVADGSVKRQTYLLDGEVIAQVRVLALQKAGGLAFPAMAVVDMPGLGVSLEVDMGPAEVNPTEKPRTEPPEDKRGVPLL